MPDQRTSWKEKLTTMNGFHINVDSVAKSVGDTNGISKSLYNQSREVILISKSLCLSNGQDYGIGAKLRESAAAIEKESTQLVSLVEALLSICKTYADTENRLSGNHPMEDSVQSDPTTGSLPETIKDYIDSLDFGKINWKDVMLVLLGMVSPPLIPYLMIVKVIQYLQEKERERIASLDPWVAGFKDRNTQEILSQYPDYALKIKETYDRSGGTAKELYDRYKSDIVIASMDESGSYHSGGKLYINYDGNIKDPRGADSVYYHETGHFIVYENGWTGDNASEFSAFDQAVKSDVSSFISEIENKYYAQYEGKYTGAQLDNIVERKTMAELKSILGVDPRDNTRYHALDGVSDMIDAASNGKYQPSYGHGETYWDDNPTRQGNEAFAEMFSADFCGDTVELDFIKDKFPNAYREYEQLKEVAIHRE